jgi:hypothetical protein
MVNKNKLSFMPIKKNPKGLSFIIKLDLKLILKIVSL